MKWRSWLVVGGLVGVVGCGGSDNASDDDGGGSALGSWTAGQFPSSDSLEAQCATPRSGSSAVTGRAFPDRAGSTTLENAWLRSWTHELYLWYSEVPDLNPAGTPTTAAYFDLLKTSARTPSGNPKDKFHFTYPTAEWEQLSVSGISAGYGAQWAVIASRPPRQIRVAYTEPSSPAIRAGLARGARVLTVDGVDAVNAGDQASVDRLNAGLFPAASGGSHTFSVLDPGASSPRTLTMVAADVTSTPVQNVRILSESGGAVGYMLFNDHIATAEAQLVKAFQQLAGAKVKDLVLDLRYNGGGYLDIASEVAYMIAGPAATAGKTFEETQFNDQHPSTNPVTGRPLDATPFWDRSQGFSGPSGVALPTLDLSRVYVLTSDNTCSASEAIMNGLRGVGIQVVQIGQTTCGKPYGFYPADNCGTTYFSIQFRGINQQGFGDYADGFSPANTVTTPGVTLPGCSVADDFGHALGDPREGRLAVALGHRLSGRCPAAASVSASSLGDEAMDVVTPKGPWRENRISRR